MSEYNDATEPDGPFHSGTQGPGAQSSDLTMEIINEIDDLIEAMTVAEENDVDISGLDSDKEIKTRLKCHLAWRKNGNLKEKIDKQVCELGNTDMTKRGKLAKMIKELENIFPDNSSTQNTTRQAMIEKLLSSDGTTENIRDDCDKRIASLQEKECVILVSGESSAGKSSLLNLFLGENILPSHMLPCTSCITVIKYNEHRCAQVIYKNGEITTIPDLDKAGLEQLQQRAYYSDANKNKDVFSQRKEEHEIAEIQVFLPLEMLKSGLVLVDTPGIGENEFLENYLMEYIRAHQILGFMYIIMTDNALGIAEDRLVNLMSLIIKSQKSSSDVVKFNPKAALFVCNRWDMVQNVHKAAVRESALKQLGKAWPDFDPKNAVFFSTFQAQREQDANLGYITDDFVALLHGFHSLVLVSQDKRIKASYRWLGTVLQRSVHYLRTVVRHLELSGRNRQKKSQETTQKLKTLNQKADGVIKRLYDEMEVSVREICREVMNYLQTMQAKTKLMHKFGTKEGELPDMERASGTWEWVKRHIDTAFDNRLTDLLAEWDSEVQVIKKVEKKLFREAKLELSSLENELADVENEAQRTEETNVRRSEISLGSLCRSIEDFEDDGLLEVDVPKKLINQLKHMFSKTVKKKQEQSKLKGFEKDPTKVAHKRAEKLLSHMIKNNDNRLDVFVRDFLQRPFNYIRKLENKIPSLIKTNMTLLEKFEKDLLEESKGRQQYIEMMEKFERMRTTLLKYGEHHFFVNDFAEDEIEILPARQKPNPVKKTLTKKSSLSDLMRSDKLYAGAHYPFGLWHTVHIGKITKGSETQYVVVKLYSRMATLPNVQQEVAKLRCLLHNDVSIAEFLGVYQQRETPTPALIFAGKLMSVSNYLKTRTHDKRFDTTKVLRDVLAGLQYIHSKGLVHMELTRDSVTICDTGEVKMTSICLPRTATLPKQDPDMKMLTELVYLSPEVLKGSLYVTTADMYSFALLSLEVKMANFTVFGDRTFDSLDEFLTENVKTALEENVMYMPFPMTFSKKLLLNCLEKDESRRPSAVTLSKEFDNIDRKSVATPRSIFGKTTRLGSKFRK